MPLNFFLFILLTLFSSSLFAMTTLDGRPAHIDNYKDNKHWLIVQAWTSGCSICNQTAADLVKSAYQFPNARLIGVSLDDNATIAKQFIQRHHINFPTLLSNNNEFNDYLLNVAQEGLTGTPTFLIFNPQGKLVGMQAGSVEPAVLINFLEGKQ